HDDLLDPFTASEPQPRAHRLSRASDEALYLVPFLSERFDDAERAEDLLDDAERVAVELPQRSGLPAQAWAEEPCGDDQARRDTEGDHGDGQVDPCHHVDHADERR